MEPSDELMITLYNKRDRFTSSVYVKKIFNNVYQVLENDLFNTDLTLGTEFETRPNKDGELEVIKILKKSPFTTRKFFLNNQFTGSDYKVLGDEIMKVGGFWQVDFGGIATINLPQNCPFDIDKVFKVFDFKPTEIL